ncbi:MAG TPA: isocitrate/isopropylmalate family dehydrogenase [Mycobacteriales bacterium]|nr:isocitrate/isopropylmalate family dehydrogenase [Mycobacteriales bacterium]
MSQTAVPGVEPADPGMRNSRTGPFRIAVLPGDGIGREIMPPTIEVLDALAADEGLDVRWTHLDWGTDRYLSLGSYLEPADLDGLVGQDAILLGAVGDPRVPDDASLWGLLLPIRQRFRQAVNLRPIMSFDGIAGPLRNGERFDFLIVRENNEGEYAGVGGRLFSGGDREVAIESSVFTRMGAERVIRLAFDTARSRRGRLVSATKSNALRYSMTFWDAVVRDVATDYPDVNLESVHIDALAARLVRSPHDLDVIVASNLFGDILADLGAALMGSLGLAPSANLNIDGDLPSMFEPVHGSAPDITGRGIANPMAQLLSAALMLRHLGAEAAADRLERAVRLALSTSAGRTPDVGGTATTIEAARAVSAALAAAEGADRG